MKLLLILIIVTFSEQKVLKSGIFDNVTVILINSNSKSKIVVDFDDNLSKSIKNNPSPTIIIQDQYIPKLETNSISHLINLENLTLSRNAIREIRRGAFRNLPHLRYLNLSYNELEEIYEGIFNNFSLQELDLSWNKIARIGYKAFSNLNLKKLFLNNNKISRWSKDWFADSSFQLLDISWNFIEDLPENSFNLMLEPSDGSMSVFFTGNQLRKINNYVFSGFKKFKRIYFDSNQIDRLSLNAFNNLRVVNILNLNNNSLNEIDRRAFRNTKIDILMVEDNRLRCLSTDLFQMEELDIDGNPITCFCVNIWLKWRDQHSNPSIYHITNLEQDCI